jgi:hypothetical protein
VLIGGLGSTSAQTGDGGIAVIEHVIAGDFSVDALFGILHGSTFGILAANEQKTVLVKLPPTASIAGTVLAPNDAPVDAGTVVVDGQSFSAAIKPDGSFRIDGMLLGSYSLTAIDKQGRVRAHTSAPIVLASLNQVAQASLKFVGFGSVGGRVVNPDGSSAQDISVQIRSLNAQFGRFAFASTNAGGFYSAIDLPVGDVTISAANPTLHLRAEGSTTIAHDGDTAAVDLILENNLIDLPANRWDANNFQFDIQKDASILNGTNTVFTGLYAGKTWGGSILDISAGGTTSRFTGSSFGTTDSNNRQIVVHQDNLAGLSVTRKVFVPSAGYFARYLEILANPTGAPVSVDVRVSSAIQGNVGNQDSAAAIIATSSGDNLLDVSDPATRDRWVVLDDTQAGDPFVTQGLPATSFVFDGANAASAAASATFTAPDPQILLGPRQLAYGWSGVTIPAGGTVALMHFIVQEIGRPAAQAAAERLEQLPPEALAGLAADELAEIQNFAAPAGGVSALAPIASLNGSVAGRALASDDATAVAGAPVRFQSSNLLFSRTYQTTSAADGSFSFTSTFTDGGTSRAIAVGDFTLRADHPTVGALVSAPPTLGHFDVDSPTAQQDVVFANTGISTGIVRLNGAPIAGAVVTASALIGNTLFNVSTQTTANGSYAFALLPAASVTFAATATVQGIQVHGSTISVVAGGQTSQSDISIDTIAPQVTITAPAAGAKIDPRSPLQVSVNGTDQGGVAQISLQASGTTTFAESRPITPPQQSITQVFAVPFATLPPTGGSLTLSASSRDGAGNQATAATVTVSVLDVVAPQVVLVSPATGAVEIEPTVAPVIQFSEPIARTSVTAGSLTLTSGGTPVSASFAFGDSDRAVTITPAQPLALNRLFTLVAGGGITDVAGNPLSTMVSSTFKTKSPDTTPPRVLAIAPANGAVNVPVGSDVAVTFTEPVARPTITSSTFRVSIGGSPVAGRLAFGSTDAAVRFVPDAPFPFDAIVVVELTSAITDVWDNALVDQNGGALTVPLTFTFATGTFGITSPAAGTEVLESSQLILEAKASAALNVATVTFTVNGTTLPVAAGPPFTTTINVGTAAATPTLTITAVGKNAGGGQVAQDQVVVSVAQGLRADQRLLGVPLGGSSSLRLFLGSPLATDLNIQLAAVDATIAAPAASAVIRAGETEVVVTVAGLSAGATTITATSARGTAWAVASVSQPVAKTMRVEAPTVLMAVIPGRSLGLAFVAASGNQTIPLTLLSTPAAVDTTVTISSSNAASASVTTAVSISVGSRIANVPITAGVAGTSTLTLRAGNEISQLTLVVGPPFVNVPPIVTKPVGFVTLAPPTLGSVFAPVATHSTVNLRLLATPAATDTVVSLTSNNAGVAMVTSSVTIPAGSLIATFDLTTGTQGTATLTLRTASDVRLLSVIVGTPPAGALPVTVAEPVGVVALQPPIVGRVFGGAATHSSVTLKLLSAPAAVATTVVVTSSNPNVVTVNGPVVIAAGSQTATIDLSNGIEGTATLTFRAGGEVRQLSVVVGTPPPGTIPVVIAQPVSVAVLQQQQLGHLFSAVGGQPTVGLTLLATAASVDTPVFVTTSDPNVAGVTGPALIAAGTRTATLHVLTGVQGVATLTITAGERTSQLVVVVGTPPAALLPIITAPVVGLEIKK